MRNSKVLLGVVAGIAVGAALGVIFAPEKGSRTRRRLIRKGEDLRALINDKVEDKLGELVDLLADEKRKLKNQLSSSLFQHGDKTL